MTTPHTFTSLRLLEKSMVLDSMGGIQTQGGGYKSPNHNTDGSSFSSLGRIGIFSRWGIRDPNAIKIAPNGRCESSGYEGDFVSVRNSVDWSKGSYTLDIRNTHESVTIDSVLHTYVEMSIYNHQTSELVSIESLPSRHTNGTREKKLYVY